MTQQLLTPYGSGHMRVLPLRGRVVGLAAESPS